MMAPRLLAPSKAALPDNLLVSTASPHLSKILAKLSRPSLLDVARRWLKKENHRSCSPFLSNDTDTEDDDTAYPSARTIDELQETYDELSGRKGSRAEVVDRILEGDWRHGLSLRQLAMLDMQFLMDHPASQKWTALKLIQLTVDDGEPAKKKQRVEHDPMPQFHNATFLRNMQDLISPVVKAHYHIQRADDSLQLPMTIMRIYVTDSPYNKPQASKRTNLSFTDASKTVYVAFPDSCPWVYVSLNSAALSGGPAPSSSASDHRFLKKAVLDAIPKALSSQHRRYRLETTSLSARSLPALFNLRGNGKTNNAQGRFTIFADGSAEDSPVEPTVHVPENRAMVVIQRRKTMDTEKENIDPYPTSDPPQSIASQTQSSQRQPKRSLQTARNSEVNSKIVAKRRKTAANRFGTSGMSHKDEAGLDRFEVRLEERLRPDLSATFSSVLGQHLTPSQQPSQKRSSFFDSYSLPDDVDPLDDPDRPSIRLTFSGAHVFAGMRSLVEQGVINGQTMPRWLTGEEGVSMGVSRDGKMLRKLR